MWTGFRAVLRETHRLRGRHLRGAPAALALALALVEPTATYAQTKVLCLGDALTEGYGVEPERAFPALVEKKFVDLGKDVRIINAGISGSTSASAVSRLRWQLRGKPDVVLLALGGNDGLRGLRVDQTRKNLDEAIALAKSSGVKVLLAGMKLPPNYGPEYTSDFEEIYPALAKERGIALIPFLLEGVAARPELNLPDGIHPNARGHEIVAETVFSHLRPLL